MDKFWKSGVLSKDLFKGTSKYGDLSKLSHFPIYQQLEFVQID
jgi:hypothetical protein